ncbi:MAG: hypothetical protein L0229_08360 [Blastocatellia bacterium]|nr:hypothetical protein [Blastocatellia bacterium]
MSTPKTIKDKLADIPGKVETVPGFGDLLSQKSIKAILAGSKSPEWKDCMLLIVGPDAPNQLARLTFEDDHSEQDWLKRNAAYIVANATCGTDTTTRTSQGVDDTIDQDLDPEPFENSD